MRFERPAAVSPRHGVRRKRPEAGATRSHPAIDRYAQPKSHIVGAPCCAASVNIAAQRRKLARSLLEWRLHGAKTLGNMDSSTGRTSKNDGAGRVERVKNVSRTKSVCGDARRCACVGSLASVEPDAALRQPG